MSHHQAGNSNTATGVEVMELTADSAAERAKHEQLLVDLEAKKRAFQIDVPTLPEDVRKALREIRQPVRLFGENLANVRDRLRMELARRQVMSEGGISAETVPGTLPSKAREEEEEQVTKYTRATPELVQAREAIAKFSLERARARLDRERKLRAGAKRKRLLLANQDASTDNDAEIHVITQIDNSCENMYKSLRKVTLEGSQYGDARALSAITTFVSPHDSTPLVATASWSATIKLWDASELRSVGTTELAHEDRIMGIAIQNIQQDTICATASIDMTAKLWKVERSQDVMMDTGDDEDIMPYTISELAVLKGHAARLCKTAFHPMGQHVATTSFDHSWRLWDVPTKTEVLLQDGHARPVYGLGFHPDGSLLATTDFCGVVHNWDLRTGKTIWHMEKGHAKRVLCAQYNPNGFQLATAGDDGTIKVWDLRKRQVSSSIPAHSNLITQVEVAEEYIASSSFDGTAKLWSTRDYKLLTTLRGHEGKVTGVGLVPGDGHRIVTSGYDKTIKLWK